MRLAIEFILLSLAALGLNLLLKKFVFGKCNKVTKAIFAFIGAGLILFLLSPYFVKSVNPAWLFFPMLILLFVRDLKDSFQEEK